MKKAHIIAHSHWDREWYLPYREHQLRLVNLIDQIIENQKGENAIDSFHLDGHTLPLEDYLEIKPNNREILKKLVGDGRLKVGPWYVLADAFLTSSESNIRNLQIGDKISKEFGEKTKIGYYPDTFGIYSQAAQIMKMADIDNIFFGRGVSPTGFNNQVTEDFQSKYSELKLKSPDGTEMLGILFANWYSNGIEIPTNVVESSKWWKEKLEDVTRYTKSDNLLFMNGCDHQPLQKDLNKAIQVASQNYKDIEFVNSSLEEYLRDLKQDLNFDSLSTIEGELKSQNTDGLFTLVNTASSRIYEKKQNVILQDRLEYIVEPLATMISKEYPREKIEFAWKMLLKNHAHDSICGCSIDSVHKSVDNRFMDVDAFSNAIIKEINEEISPIYPYDSRDNFIKFYIANTFANTQERLVSVELQVIRRFLDSNSEIDAKKQCEEFEILEYVVVDRNGNEYDVDLIDKGVSFKYELPDNKFRRPYFCRVIEIKFIPKIEQYSIMEYELKEIKEKNTINYGNISSQMDTSEICNEYISFEYKDGVFNLKNKLSNDILENIFTIIDEGDIGNEYMHGNVKDDKEIKLEVDSVTSKNYRNYETMNIIGHIDVPMSATKLLKEEQLALVPYYERNAERSEELTRIPISLNLTLDKVSDYVKININYTNKAKDHRMRLKFNLNKNINFVNVDSTFDVVKRSVNVNEKWKNPNNDQQMSKFVSVPLDNGDFTVSTVGLSEYEYRNNSLYVTLLRSIGEMGDWGYFPTPEAQCIGTFDFDFTISFNKERSKTFDYSRTNLINMISHQIQHPEINDVSKKLLDIDKSSNVSVTSISKDIKNRLVLRAFCVEGSGYIRIKNNDIYESNFFGEKISNFSENIGNKEIKTFVIEN